MRYLVTGAAGQDGILISRLLLEDEVEVIGICKEAQIDRLSKNLPGVTLDFVDKKNSKNITDLLQKYRPTHIINLAGFSSVKESWHYPYECLETNSGLVTQIIEWLAMYSPNSRLIQASSSEIFGASDSYPQNETYLLSPSSPYGIAKSFSHNLIKVYRQKYSLNVSSAILYNHESPLRKSEFVTKHIVRNVARISMGLQDTMTIGNMDAKRDWGWAPDYVLGMKKMASSENSEDFIFATGVQHSVRDFLSEAFELIGIKDYSTYITQDENSLRSVDPSNLCGDSSLAKKKLSWGHTKNFSEIVKIMYDWELKVLQGENPDSWLQS